MADCLSDFADAFPTFYPAHTNILHCTLNPDLPLSLSETTFFVVSRYDDGKFRNLRLIDSCSPDDVYLYFQATHMTSIQRHDNGIYSAVELGIKYGSISEYNIYKGLLIDLESQSFDEEYYIRQITLYWHRCAHKYFETRAA